MQTIAVILYYTATEQTIEQWVLSHDSKRVFVNSSAYAVVHSKCGSFKLMAGC